MTQRARDRVLERLSKINNEVMPGAATTEAPPPVAAELPPPTMGTEWMGREAAEQDRITRPPLSGGFAHAAMNAQPLSAAEEMEHAQEVEQLQQRLAAVKAQRVAMGLGKPDFVIEHGASGQDDEVKFNYEAISKDMPVAHKAALMRLDVDGNGQISLRQPALTVADRLEPH